MSDISNDKNNRPKLTVSAATLQLNEALEQAHSLINSSSLNQPMLQSAYRKLEFWGNFELGDEQAKPNTQAEVKVELAALKIRILATNVSILTGEEFREHRNREFRIVQQELLETGRYLDSIQVPTFSKAQHAINMCDFLQISASKSYDCASDVLKYSAYALSVLDHIKVFSEERPTKNERALRRKAQAMFNTALEELKLSNSCSAINEALEAIEAVPLGPKLHTCMPELRIKLADALLQTGQPKDALEQIRITRDSLGYPRKPYPIDDLRLLTLEIRCCFDLDERLRIGGLASRSESVLEKITSRKIKFDESTCQVLSNYHRYVCEILEELGEPEFAANIRTQIFSLGKNAVAELCTKPTDRSYLAYTGLYVDAAIVAPQLTDQVRYAETICTANLMHLNKSLGTTEQCTREQYIDHHQRYSKLLARLGKKSLAFENLLELSENTRKCFSFSIWQNPEIRESAVMLSDNQEDRLRLLTEFRELLTSKPANHIAASLRIDLINLMWQTGHFDEAQSKALEIISLNREEAFARAHQFPTTAYNHWFNLNSYLCDLAEDANRMGLVAEARSAAYYALDALMSMQTSGISFFLSLAEKLEFPIEDIERSLNLQRKIHILSCAFENQEDWPRTLSFDRIQKVWLVSLSETLILLGSYSQNPDFQLQLLNLSSNIAKFLSDTSATDRRLQDLMRSSSEELILHLVGNLQVEQATQELLRYSIYALNFPSTDSHDKAILSGFLTTAYGLTLEDSDKLLEEAEVAVGWYQKAECYEKLADTYYRFGKRFLERSNIYPNLRRLGFEYYQNALSVYQDHNIICSQRLEIAKLLFKASQTFGDFEGSDITIPRKTLASELQFTRRLLHT